MLRQSQKRRILQPIPLSDDEEESETMETEEEEDEQEEQEEQEQDENEKEDPIPIPEGTTQPIKPLPVLYYTSYIRGIDPETKETVKPIEIDREDVNTFDFSGKVAFFELRPMSYEYTRFYIDTDEIKTREDYEELSQWVDSLVPTLGPYVFGGYTTKPDIFPEFYYAKHGNHVLSLHYYFTTTQVKISDLLTVMTFEKKAFVYNVNRFVDKSVYKKQESEQLMRHICSKKIAKDGDHHNSDTRGGIITPNAKPSDALMTPIGTERKVTWEELDKLFEVSKRNAEIEAEKNKKAPKKQQKEAKTLLKAPKRSRKAAIDALTEFDPSQDYEDKLIMLGDDELLELLAHFPPEDFLSVWLIRPLFSSPYDKDYLMDIVDRWYNNGEREHTQPDSAKHCCETYYTHEDSNRWFFSLIRRIESDDLRDPDNEDDETGAQYARRMRSKYCKQSIDFTKNINNTSMTFEEFSKRSYGENDMGRVLTDLRKIVGWYGSQWYIKRCQSVKCYKKDNVTISTVSQIYIETRSREKMRELFINHKPFPSFLKVTSADLVCKYSNYFRYDGTEWGPLESYDDGIKPKDMAEMFAQMNEEQKQTAKPLTFINMFQGFLYKEVYVSKEEENRVLQPLKDHVFNVIANKDKDMADYLWKWFALIVQRVTVKAGTFPIIIGAEGSGKSFLVELILELFGKYAVKDASINDVYGNFNAISLDRLLVCINEAPQQVGDKRTYEDEIKKAVTQKSGSAKRKGIDVCETENWANYIMTTNNPNPTSVGLGNRRQIIYETNDEYAKHLDYFDRLCIPFQPIEQGPYNEYRLGILLHYLKTLDISHFKPGQLITQLRSNPNTDGGRALLTREITSLRCTERFIVENYKLFLDDGLKPKPIKYKTMKSNWSQYFKGWNELTIKSSLLQYILRLTPEGSHKSIEYQMKDETEKPDIYRAIRGYIANFEDDDDDVSEYAKTLEDDESQK